MIDFLDYELRTGVPLYFDGFFFPLNKLMDLLNVAAQELQTHEAAEKTNRQKIHKSTPVEKVIAFVKAGLSPQAIFLVHKSLTENNHQLFDLLVVLSASSKTRFTNYEQVITMANMEDIIINVSAQGRNHRKAIERWAYYYSMVCNNQHLLYSNGKALSQPNKHVLIALAQKAKMNLM